MQYVDAVGVDGNKLRVQAVTRRVDVTPLDSQHKEWSETITAVIVDGRQIQLNQDDTFHHPVTDKLYEVDTN